MTKSLRALAFLYAGIAVSPPAFAQSESDFIEAFSGEWYVFDAAMRDGSQTCKLNLNADATDSAPTASTAGCAMPLDTVSTWSIDEGRIILAAEGGEIAVLGGNQFRVTGDFSQSGDSLVVERAQGDGNSVKIAAALRKHRCFYLGFTQDCADQSDLGLPEIDADAGFAEVTTLATLNARAQPRRDAPILGSIAAGTNVRVNQCLSTSDGPWCRARFGDGTVWLAMTALRQEEWPIVTYTPADAAD